MTLDPVPFGGWERCYRLANARLELVVTAEVGPRVLRLAAPGGENLFWVDETQLGARGGDAWRIYGGHRLWHAPEARPRSYAPDNDPVAVEARDGALVARQPAEPTTGIAKELRLELHPELPRVRIAHRLENRGPWPVELAAWALTVLPPGGTAIAPLPPRGSHETELLPTGRLALWAYTDLADARWGLGPRHVRLRQGAGGPQKLGLWAPDGWGAYWREGRLFLKLFETVPAATYPDGGVCLELFTDERMLELETLGPLATLPPGGGLEHVEVWRVFDDVGEIRSDADAERELAPLVRRAREEAP